MLHYFFIFISFFTYIPTHFPWPALLYDEIFNEFPHLPTISHLFPALAYLHVLTCNEFPSNVVCYGKLNPLTYKVGACRITSFAPKFPHNQRDLSFLIVPMVLEGPFIFLTIHASLLP